MSFLHICNGLTFSLLGFLGPYMREEESQLLSWGSLLLLFLVLHIFNALGKEGVVTITDG
jgi:hypothetical protein